MNTTSNNTNRRNRRGGFTLLEIMVASTLNVIVVVALMSALIVMYRTAGECWQISWAWGESQDAVSRTLEEMRNAVAISDIDDQGQWVDLQMTTNANPRICRFEWVSFVVGDDDSGRLVYMPNMGEEDILETIVADGITKKESGGFGDPIFQATPAVSRTGLRVHFIVRQPEAPIDSQIEVDTTVTFRNG